MSYPTESPQLAIYDENYVCGISLHNSLKRLGFTVHVVSSDENELIRFLILKPAVLLFRLDSSSARAYELLKRIRQEFIHLKILVQTVISDHTHTDELKKHGATAVLSGHFGFRKLIEKLVEVEINFNINAYGIIDIGASVNRNLENPFLKIAIDHRKLLLTQLICAGHSTKIIAQIMDSSESDIEALRKKLLHETNCQNAAEFIGRAKDNKII